MSASGTAHLFKHIYSLPLVLRPKGVFLVILLCLGYCKKEAETIHLYLVASPIANIGENVYFYRFVAN